MYQSLMKLYGEFSAPEKRNLFGILITIVASGLIQVIGIASIFPFIGVATNPELIQSNKYLHTLFELVGFNNQNEFLIFLGCVVLFFVILSNAFLAFSTFVTMRFVEITTNKFSYRLLMRYLGETYIFHLNRNSAELLKNLTAEVSRVVNGGIMCTLEICSKGFTIICILALLIAVDPVIALMSGFILGGAYGLIYFSLRVKLAEIGHRVMGLFTTRHRYIIESLGGIKDLMVLGRQAYYLEKYREICKQIIHLQVINRSAVDLPKYVVETVAFGGILAITIYLISTNDNSQAIMPTIALYGFAGLRLMPALQGLFRAIASLRHDIPAVDLFYDDLKGTPEQAFSQELLETPNYERLHFSKSIRLDNVSFAYPDSQQIAVNNIQLTIEKNTSLGIVGTSGSGKSTLVDVILGLLKPSSGGILIDDELLDDSKMSGWQNIIGYVPQSIFLSDSSITDNIAFGIRSEDLDMDAVFRAAKMANIHDFITEELDQGYSTVVGERGVRLSGGQRQRIGIARALYHNPELLILDEATSALDGTSEKAVIDAVNELSGKVTIIMIAHRLSTVQSCQKLIWLEKGSIRAEGNFDALLQTEEFQRFAHPDIERVKDYYK